MNKKILIVAWSIVVCAVASMHAQEKLARSLAPIMRNVAFQAVVRAAHDTAVSVKATESVLYSNRTVNHSSRVDTPIVFSPDSQHIVITADNEFYICSEEDQTYQSRGDNKFTMKAFISRRFGIQPACDVMATAAACSARSIRMAAIVHNAVDNKARLISRVRIPSRSTLAEFVELFFPSRHQPHVTRLPYSFSSGITRSGIMRSAFSPDGTLLAVASSADREELPCADSKHNVIEVLDFARNECIARLNYGLGFVRRVAFSPDGSLLVAALNHGCMQIWDLKKSTCIKQIDTFGTPTALTFLPDSKRFIAHHQQAGEGYITLSDAQHVLDQAKTTCVSGTALTHDGSVLTAIRRFPAVDCGRQVECYDVKADKLSFKAAVKLLDCVGAPITSETHGLAFSPDGKLLAVLEDKSLSFYRADALA